MVEGCEDEVLTGATAGAWEADMVGGERAGATGENADRESWAVFNNGAIMAWPTPTENARASATLRLIRTRSGQSARDLAKSCTARADTHPPSLHNLADHR